jgi:AraC-like DNA-binding protein
VPERSLTVLAEAARRAGIGPNEASLAPTRFRICGTVFVPAAEYGAVLSHVFAQGDETVGVALARHLPVEASGLWGFLLRTSPSFGDMLQRAARYTRVFFRYSRLDIARCRTGLRLTCEHPAPGPFGNRGQEVCFFLGQWITWGRALLGPEVAAREVRMRWSGPEDPAPVRAFFGGPVGFAAREDSLVFPAELARAPLPECTPELTQVFEAYAEALIDAVRSERSFADRVRDALSEGLLGGTASEQETARRLGMTQRTLRRRLAEEGLTFRTLRRDLLRTRAERLLADDRLPLAEIAYLLGYSEPATFHRAFRSWTGKTPAAWRRERR